MKSIAILGSAAVLAAATVSASAQNVHCFSGRDHTGGPAVMMLQVDRYVTFAEIRGIIRSGAIGTMQVKADFGSGAGRAFYGHEYESGAVFINFTNVAGDYSSYVLSVDGYGQYPFSRVTCR